MVIITLQTVEHLLTPEQKTQIIAQLTNVVLAVKGEAFQRLTWIKLEEIPAGNLGVGGIQIHAPDFERFRHRRPAVDDPAASA